MSATVEEIADSVQDVSCCHLLTANAAVVCWKRND